MANLREVSDKDKVKNNKSDNTNKNFAANGPKEKKNLREKVGNGAKKIGGKAVSGAKNAAGKMEATARAATSDLNGGSGGEAANDIAQKGVNGAKKAGKGALNLGKKAANSIRNARKNAKKRKKQLKRIKQVIKLVIKLVKMVIQFIIKLIMTFWYVFLALAVIGIIAGLLFAFNNNASIRGNYFIDAEVTSSYNVTDTDENGETEITEVTMENKLVRAFYYYFSEKSIWIMTDGTVTTESGTKNSGVSTNGDVVQYRSKKYIDLFGDPDKEDADIVQDKYNRETEFYINPNALYVLDKYLHDQKFRFPEQIIKHVAYEENPDYSASGNGGISGDFSGSESAQICWNYYRSKGFSEEQTAGLVGNLYAESHSFDPHADNGSHKGIVQWDVGRWANLQQFASAQNKDPYDLELQLAFSYKELSEGYKSRLDNAGWSDSGLTVEKATTIIRKIYEGCGNQGADVRLEAANRYYNQFKGTSGGNSSSTNAEENSSKNISDAYATWKQTDERWCNLRLSNDHHSGDTVYNSGCFATSLCVLAAYSGAESKDESVFNPAIGIPKLNFYSGSLLAQESVSKLGDGSLTWEKDISCTSKEDVINEVKNHVSDGYFYVIHVTGHFIPVVGVTDNDILINDVGRKGDVQTLSNYLANTYKVLLTDRTLRVFKSSKTNMKECGNVSYSGGSSSNGVNSIPYRLKQLTDEDGNVCVDSTKYELKTIEEPVYKTVTETETGYVEGFVGDEKKDLVKAKTIDRDGNETITEKQTIKIPDVEVVEGTNGAASKTGTYAVYKDKGSGMGAQTAKYVYNVEYSYTVKKEVKTDKTIKRTYYVKTDEKEKGVWDYGFGSIVFYNKYEEKTENRGKIVSFECWDSTKESTDEEGLKIKGGKVSMTVDQYNTLSDEDKKNITPLVDPNKEIKPWDAETNDIYMIKWAITPAGSIANGITCQWVDTGIKVEGDAVYDTKTITYKRQVIEQRTTTDTVEPGQWTIVEKGEDIEGNSIGTQRLQNDSSEPQKLEYSYIKYKTVEESIKGYAQVSGTKYEWRPVYNDENVDLSGITGTRYYKDYLYNYAGYVPTSVQGVFNFNEIKERTGKSEKELDKILENSKFSKDDTTTLEFYNEEGEYTGLGSIQNKYETGGEIGNADIAHYEHDGYNPGWGFANFTEDNCKAFMKWLKEKDKDFYKKYFGSVEIDPSSNKTPFYDAWQSCANAEPQKFTQYYIAFSYKNDCYDPVLNSSKIKDDAILGQIDWTRSFPLQEMVYNVGCAGPAILIEVLKNCGITASDDDATIILKMGKYMSTDAFANRWYKSIYHDGVKNRWSPEIKTSETNLLITYIEENGDVAGFEYDPETELFTGSGVASQNSREGIFKAMYKKLKGLYNDFKGFVSDILLGEEYEDVLEDEYWNIIRGGALKDNQADWILSAMFAYNDEDKITEYEIDDDYFKLMYQQLFSSEGTTGVGANVKERYFGGKTTNPVEADKDFSITNKYNTKTDQVLQISVKSGTEIKAISNGKVIKIAYDAKYGGSYLMIQHSGCVSIYGHLDNNLVQKGDTVKAGQVVATSRSVFYFGLRTKQKGSYINPTSLFEDSIDMSNTGTVDVGIAGTVDSKERLNWLFPNGVPTNPTQMQQYLTVISVPVIDRNGKESTMTLTVHKKLANEITEVFKELKEIGFPVNSDTGGYSWRQMAASSSLSHHSYGCVIDLNANSNPMIVGGKVISGKKYAPGVDPYSVTKQVVEIWKKHGFYWGGDWTSTPDYMHFTYTNH